MNFCPGVKRWLAATLLLLGGGAAYSPEVTALSPAGGQRGTEVDVVVRGQRLFEPAGLLCARPGLEVVAVAAEKPERCKITLRIAPDCPLGAHPLRLRTAYGLSNVVLFHVGVLPEIARAEGSAPQAIPLDCTVNGNLAEGGVDRFAVAVPAGLRVHCEVEAVRLGFNAIDLALAVRDADGHELASGDDSSLGLKDPIVSFTAPTTGMYRLEVRTAFADPSNRGAYRLHVGTFPRPTVALPGGGPAGATIVVELRGDGPPSPTAVTLPDEPDSVFAFFPSSDNGTAPTPVYLRVGGPPERQPTVDDKMRSFVQFPASVSGVVSRPDQGERFFFHAEKGSELVFRALARTLRSPLDPLLILRQGDGRYLAANDDQAGLGMDSYLRFKASVTGDYQIEVRDVLRRASPMHVFRLEGEPPGDRMSLRLAVGRRDEAIIDVPQGARMGGVLLVDAAGDDQLELRARDLPAGLHATLGSLRRGLSQVPVLFSADADIPLQHALVEFGVHGEVPPVDRAVPFAQKIPLVTVRNDQPIWSVGQRALPVAVTKAAPFSIDVAAPSVPIVRDAPLVLTVRVRRAGNDKTRVRVRALWTPPGLSAGEVVVEPGHEEATLSLSASGSAMLGEFPFAVVGTAYLRGGRLQVASDFVTLTVDEPWISGKLGAARTEQGAGVAMRATCKFTHAAAGKAKVCLLGLPRGVTADPVEVEPGADTIVFALQVGNDAAPGRHRSVLVEAAVPSPGGDVVCRFGGGELRIDPPLSSAGGTAADRRPR